jgi:porin
MGNATAHKGRRYVVALLIGVAWISAASAAQQNLPEPKNDAPKAGHLFGDWDGIRSDLADRGVTLSLDYIGEEAGSISGGKRDGADYAQQLQLQLDIDWKKLAGLDGFSTHAVLVNRAGRNLSTDYVGDNLFQAQEIYGGAGDVLVHLVYLYGEESLADGHLDIAAGRLPVGNDFATSPLYCDFMETAICGYPHSLPNKVGFTAYPNSTWGGRVRADPGDRIYVQAGIYQVRPMLGGREGFDWGTSGTTGAYIPVEIGYEPTFGEDVLPGHYKLGVTHDTSLYPDLYLDVDGNPIALTGAAPLEHHGRGSIYLLADQLLMRNGNGPMNGLIAFGGYVVSSRQTSEFTTFAFGGLVDQGIIAARPDDSVGISLAYAKIGNPLIRTEEIQASLGAPLAMGAEGIQSNEVILEGRYDFRVADGLHVMPDIQYVIRPGATERYENTTILALHIAADL